MTPYMYHTSLLAVASHAITALTPMPTTLTLRRGAYTGPTGRSAGLNKAASLAAAIVILAGVPLSSLRYLLTRPKGFTLKSFVIIRALRLLSLLTPILPPPETHAERWDAPKTIGKTPALKLETVTASPAPDKWCVGYAACPDGVAPLEMPGYVLTPSGIASGPARPDEKIILYIHGGGYVRGHPLWTAFPFRLAAKTRRAAASTARSTARPWTTGPPSPRRCSTRSRRGRTSRARWASAPPRSWCAATRRART
jgi:hypothetical protein